jgi:hypothetical protein
MKEQLRKVVRDIMQENVISQLIENDPCWKDYEMVGMKMKDGKEVPNCVPKNESSINEIEYKDAVEKFNADLMKNSQVERIAKFHKKSIKDVVKALQPYIKVLRYNDKSVKVISIDFRDTNSEVKVHVSQTYKQNESINEADVVGKTVFSDGKGKLFFGYYKTDDGVEFVDYKTWAKLSFKDVSKGDTNKDRVVNSILKNQKQFNKKVDYNMWAKKTNPSFEQKMDWFIKNGWISNINKGGIKESVELVKESVSKEAMGIAGFTGTRGSAVQDFIDKHELDAVKLFKSMKSANLQGRLNFVSALVGKDGNANQRLTIKLHKKN